MSIDNFVSSRLKGNPSNQKKFKRIVWVTAASMALFIFGLFYFNSLEEKRLLKNGIREEMVVVRKHKSGSKSKYSTYHYSMELDRFEVVGEKKFYKEKDTVGMSAAEKFSNKVLSKSFANKGRKLTKKLNNPIHIKYIDPESYNTISIGEIVTLVYEKNNPREGRLLLEIE